MSQNTLPQNWKMVQLGEVCDITMGQSPPSDTYNTEGLGMPFLQGKAEFTNFHPQPTKYCTTPLKVGKQGSVLISVRAPVGDVNLADRDYIVGRGLGAVSLKHGSNNFLFYLLMHNKERIAALGSGTTFKSVNRTVLDNFRIDLPPLCEQEGIAQALRTIQEAHEARQRELELERERKATLMQYLFTYGTHDEQRKQTEIGEIPESWQVVQFSEAVQIAQGQVDPKQEPYRSMLHVGPENIESGTGRLEAVRTNGDLNIISGNYYFTTQDILYSKIRPYLNKVALPTFDGTCSADMYPLRPRNGLLTREYLFHFMLSEHFLRSAMSFQDRTGIPKINREQLNSIRLVKPPSAEQQEIAAILTACDAKASILEQELMLLNELFRTLLEELMTGRLPTAALVEEVTA